MLPDINQVEDSPAACADAEPQPEVEEIPEVEVAVPEVEVVQPEAEAEACAPETEAEEVEDAPAASILPSLPSGINIRDLISLQPIQIA